MPEHDAILSADCHEPKHITSGTTSDSGKIITNSSSTNGESEYRAITEADVTSVKDYYVVYMADISTAQSVFVPIVNAGTFTKLYSSIQNAIATSDATITTEIGGVAVTDGGFTISYSGSAAGDVDSTTPTALNSLSAGQALEIITGGATTTCAAWFTVEITRT